jgi:integrase/recombinase XerD
MLDREPIEQFLTTLQAQKGFSSNTLAAYRNDLGQFADFLAEGQGRSGAPGKAISSWADVTRDSIVSFLLYLKERQYAATTVARKQAAIKSFFKFLVTRGAVASNPIEDLASPHVDRALPHTISTNEVERLLHAMNNAQEGPEVLRDRAMMQLLYATGLRVGETVALNVDDVDLKTNSVATSGRGKTRKVDIGATSTAEALQAYLERGRPALARAEDVGASLATEQQNEGVSTARSEDDRKALFLNHRGQRLTRQGFWLILKRYARLAGLGEISPHTLRHSFAAQKLSSGTDMRDLQQILGHANISTTQVYARIGQSGEPTKGSASKRTRAASRSKEAAS